MEAEELAKVAQRAGELLLKSGAEIYRVEDTTQRICAAYGARANAFALPTGIFVTVESGGQAVTLTLRVVERETNFARISQVNEFSRALSRRRLTYEDAMAKLDAIALERLYPAWMSMLASGLISGVFALIFDGGPAEGAVAVFIGVVVFAFIRLLRPLLGNILLEYFISGIAAGAMLIAFARLLPAMNTYSVVVGSVMMQLPGVSITNAIRDGMQGDILSGLARFVESALLIGALACGLALVMHWGGVG